MSDVYVHKNQATAQCRWTGMQGCACGFAEVTVALYRVNCRSASPLWLQVGAFPVGTEVNFAILLSKEPTELPAKHAKHGPKHAKLVSF